MDVQYPATPNARSDALSNPPLIVWLTLFGTLAVTAYVWQIFNNDVETSAQASFQRQVDKTHEAVKLRMLAYEQILRGGSGLFSASNDVSRKEWQAYVASLRVEENFPGIQAIAYCQQIKPAALSLHIKKIRAEGFAEYSVRPAGPRPEYNSIIYIEPFNTRNQRAFGFDMLTEPIRRAAMLQARDSGSAVISGKVVLKQETTTDVQAGFVMYLPLYGKNAEPDTAEERAKALLGYIASPFRMHDLMHGILGGDGQTMDVDLEVYDGAEVTDKTLMYDHDGIPHAGNEKKHRLLNNVKQINVQGHIWTLAVTSTPAFEARIDRTKPMIIAFSGTIISLLFFAVAWSLATQRARAQAIATGMTNTLREQRALTQAIVNDAADGIITINEFGQILSFNHAAEVIFGYASDEVLGEKINMLMPEPYHSAHDSYLQNYLATGHKKIIGIGREVTGLRKNGETFPMDLAVSEVQNIKGWRLFAGIVRDISERKQVESSLRLSEDRFDLAIRGANDGLWDWDMKTNTSYHSPRWNAMFGYPEVETSSPSADWLKHIHPDDVARVKDEVTQYLDEHTPRYSTEFRKQHKDGHYVWILSRGIAQRDKQGKPYRMVGIYSDISKQKQMDSMKSEFVSTVSHELRTPLTSIRGSLGLLAGGVTGELPAQAKSMIDLACRNTERLLSLINDILDIDKIQSGQMDFNLRPQPLMPLIEQVMAANAGYAEQYQVKFNLLSGLPSVMVNVDGDRLMQVMSNLLSNAAKFSHAGGTVDVAVTRKNHRVHVAVRDHGVGISAAFHERIFQKFTQGDSSDTRHKGGTGLGLNISKAIIEMMQGEIGFESAADAGTTFYFTLPEWPEETA